MPPVVGDSEVGESGNGCFEEEGKRMAVGLRSCELEGLDVDLMVGDVSEDGPVELEKGDDSMSVILGVVRVTDLPDDERMRTRRAFEGERVRRERGMPPIVGKSSKRGMREDRQLEDFVQGNLCGSILWLEEDEGFQLEETTEGDGDDAQDLVDLLRVFGRNDVEMNLDDSA